MFKLGDKVTTLDEIAAGGVFVLKGSYFTYDYPDANFSREESYRGDAYYHSPYGAALTPSAADLIMLIPFSYVCFYLFAFSFFCPTGADFFPYGAEKQSPYGNFVQK